MKTFAQAPPSSVGPRHRSYWASWINRPCLLELPKDWLGYIRLSDWVGLSLGMLLVVSNGIKLQQAYTIKGIYRLTELVSSGLRRLGARCLLLWNFHSSDKDRDRSIIAPISGGSTGGCKNPYNWASRIHMKLKSHSLWIIAWAKFQVFCSLLLFLAPSFITACV